MPYLSVSVHIFWTLCYLRRVKVLTWPLFKSYPKRMKIAYRHVHALWSQILWIETSVARVWCQQNSHFHPSAARCVAAARKNFGAPGMAFYEEPISASTISKLPPSWRHWGPPSVSLRTKWLCSGSVHDSFESGTGPLKELVATSTQHSAVQISLPEADLILN